MRCGSICVAGRPNCAGRASEADSLRIHAAADILLWKRAAVTATCRKFRSLTRDKLRGYISNYCLDWNCRRAGAREVVTTMVCYPFVFRARLKDRYEPGFAGLAAACG